MTMLAENRTEGRALTLADYEARIHLYKEQIGVGYIGIGRTLNEAKQAGVVPHGQWETWVTETTGLTPRQAQRCMKAATEIRDGSAMAQLEMSKALLLLGSGLDEDAQEKIAEKAADEGATVKALKEEIRQAKLKLVQETGTTSEIRLALKRAEDDRDGLKHQLEATIKAYQQRMDEEAGAAYRRGLQDKEAGMEREIRKEFQGKIDFLNSKAAQAEDRVRDLKAELEASRKDGSQQWDEGYEAGKRQAAEVAEQARLEGAREMDQLAGTLEAERKEWTLQMEQMRQDLEAAEAREAKRARELAELKKEKAQAGMDAARGIRAEGVSGLDLAAAVRSFIGMAGVLPQMGRQLSEMSETERGGILAQVDTVAKWVEGVRKALGVVAADASIM